MIKLLLALVFCSIMQVSNAQLVYEWVNDQYDAGDWRGGDFYNDSVNGKVKRIDFKGYNFNDDTLRHFWTRIYDEQGRISKFVSYDNNVDPVDLEGTKYAFYYSRNGDSVKVNTNAEHDLDVAYSAGRYVLIENSILTAPRADSLFLDTNGRVIAFYHNKDVTLTSYDDYGRKVLDSIPDSGMTMWHSYRYTYEGNKLIVTYDNGSGGSVTYYEVDEHGNWIRSYCIDDKGVEFNTVYQIIEYYTEDQNNSIPSK